MTSIKKQLGCTNIKEYLRSKSFLIYNRSYITEFALRDSCNIFDTTLLNFPAHQLNILNLRHLIDNSDILIAHTYLCSNYHGLRGSALVKSGTLNDKFIEICQFIADQQIDKNLITGPINELIDIVNSFNRTVLIKQRDGWNVEMGTRNNICVAGDVQTISSIQVEGGEKWNKYRVGYLMLPKREHVELRIKS